MWKQTLKAAGLAILLALALAGCGEQTQKPKGDAPPGEAASPSEDLRAQRPDPNTFGPPASGEARGFYQGEFEAVGVEPDWRLTVLDNYIEFGRTNLEPVTGLNPKRDIRANGALIETQSLLVILQAGACVHVGQTYQYKAIVQFDGVAYQGCARRATDQTGPSPTWATNLAPLLPAIDACLARVEMQPGRITFAYQSEGDMVNVRIEDADGGRYECVAQASGQDVGYFEPINDRDKLDGERNPLFSRTPTKPPVGRCLESEAAPAIDGASPGALTRQIC